MVEFLEQLGNYELIKENIVPCYHITYNFTLSATGTNACCCVLMTGMQFTRECKNKHMRFENFISQKM
jgi:hypothetical protein